MALNQPIEDCLEGRISPEVALARMLFAGGTAASIQSALALYPACVRRDAMAALAAERPRALDDLAAQVTATAADHDASGPTPAAGVARIASFFDRAVAQCAEASVALYSLGDPAILAAATEEITAWLDAHGLLPEAADVLDLGCGFGRIAAALAPRCRSVLGLDVSAGMVAEARQRYAGLSNVRFQQTGGQDLSALPDAAFDLVLAIDSFPYIVQTGPDTVRRHIEGARRVLRPGRALCILNLSYRDDPAQDQHDAAAWAAQHGLRLELADSGPFSLWDGSAYVLRTA